MRPAYLDLFEQNRLTRRAEEAFEHLKSCDLCGWKCKVDRTAKKLGVCKRCVLCQNYEISQLRQGREVTAAELAAMMIDLQQRGCHNINLVSPSHVIPSIIAAINIAA